MVRGRLAFRAEGFSKPNARLEHPALLEASAGLFFFRTMVLDTGGKFPVRSEHPFIRATGDRKRMPLACGWRFFENPGVPG